MSVTEKGFVESLLAPAAHSDHQGGAWLKARRSAALERAMALSVPTTRDEDWRFTDLSTLYRLKLKPLASDGQVDAAILKSLFFPEASLRLVFVDGRFDSAVSTESVSKETAGDGVTVAGLRRMLVDDVFKSVRVILEKHLACIADFENDVFAAANSAYLQEAAVVHVAAGCNLKGAPLQILNISTGHEIGTSPRVLIVVEQGAQCTVIEDYVAVGGTAYLTNSVCEVYVAPNAQVRHIKVQREADTAFHIANTSVQLERDARYHSWSVVMGGRISRHNLNVYQLGVGVDCEMNGLTMISGRQLADTHSLLDHAYAHGNSRQVHKTITGGMARSVFNGKILVREDAQQTNASQQSRNVLLSPRATVDTKPQLEIFADDVKCAHGATVGQVDAEELFYLRSRGLSDWDARNLLIYAFAAEVVDSMPVASVASVLKSHILEQTRSKEAG